jgi:chorismate mutase/prephenate dehydratase
MELNQLRQEIDEIDRELVSLFIRRMNCSAGVAEYKREHGLPVLDASRERALLSKISELSGEDFEEYSKELYKTILSLSREYQQKLIDSKESENK